MKNKKTTTLSVVGAERSPEQLLSEERRDGWANLITSMGMAADKRTAARVQHDIHPPEFYEQLYAGDELAARIVDLIPQEALRRWVDWTDVEKEQQKALEDRCERLDLRGSFLRAWIWGRAYGGGLLHVVTDTLDPSAPLRRGERVIGLRDLSRWDVRVLTTDIEYDFGSPNFGHPRIYYLNVQMGSQYKGYPIHWTRMIRFDGQLVPRRTYVRNGYWHDSVLNRLYNVIRNYQTSNDAAAVCLQDFNVDVYKMKNLANLVAAGKEEIVKKRVEIIQYAKSVLRAMLLDADEEEYENQGRSLEGVAELLTHQANRLVAATDIPHTKLLGESPDGSNATGNSTTQQWYNFIGSEQENYARPKLKRLMEIIAPDFPKLGFKFRALRQLDDVETADLRNKQAQTDKAYIEAGVLDPSEVTDSRFGGEEYSLDTKIDKEGREAGLIGAGTAPGMFPGEPGAEQPEGGEQEPGEEGEGGGEENEGEPTQPAPDQGNAEGDEEEEDGKGEPANPGSGLQYASKREKLKVKGGVPKDKSFISQTMSEPMRDPKTDPKMKGPGIPNKPRTFLPTRGTGVVAPSGFDMDKDAGSKGEAREQPERKDSDEPAPIERATSVIVRKGDNFLMGKRRDTGRYTLPGGMVEPRESRHQAGVRELLEETGIATKRLKFLGTRLVENSLRKPVEVTLYELNVADDADPTSKNDPDKEVSDWLWLPTKAPLPDEISGALQHPNNIGLEHLGLLR